MAWTVDDLEAIHKDVRRRFDYRSDAETRGQLEHWAIPEELSGEFEDDCDGFALACRKLCREQDVPSRLVYCAAGGVGHLVLEVDGYIFCCNQPRLAKRDRLNYQWISISGYEQGDPWHKIKGST